LHLHDFASAATTLGVAVAAGALISAAAVPITAAVGQPTTNATQAPSCHLGNGVQHVVNIVFDNVHFS
jgi:hypothetical protein